MRTPDRLAVRKLYVSTAATELATLLLQVLAYKLAAHYLGRDGFSEYALARRTLGLFLPVTMLGLGVAIPRYIAFSRGHAGAPSAAAAFATALLILGGSITLMLGLLNARRDFTAFLFFGSARYSFLIVPLSLTILGLTLHSACYGYFQGNLQMARANVLHFTNNGIVPVVVLPMFGRSSAMALTALGLVWGLVAALALLFTRLGSPLAEAVTHVGTLLKYGVGRVPADVLQLAFLALPATLVAHRGGVTLAGFLAFGISLLTLLASVFVPVGNVLLPEASRMISQGDFGPLKRRVLQVLGVVGGLVVPAILVVMAFARPIFRMYLGSSFQEIVWVVQLVVPAALPYAIYVSMRSVLDAFSPKPINSINMFKSFSLFVGLSAIAWLRSLSSVYILASFVASLYVLGALTLVQVRRIFSAAGASVESEWSVAAPS